MFKMLRSELERRLSKVLPPLLYCSAEEKLRLLMNPARRGGPKRRTGRDETGLYVEWAGGQRFYFSHQFLHNRYVWPEGLAWIQNYLLAKYQDRDVRLEAGDIVLEAGANVGEFTTVAAATASRIYAFDPDPMTFGCLAKNTAELRNVKIFHAGLGDFEGQADLYISRANCDSSFLSPRDRGDPTVRVPVTTISAVMEAEGIQRVDFLKVEAEGFEPEILAGAIQRLSDISKVAVDCGPERNGADTYAECESVLRDAGFRTWRRESDWMLFAVNEGQAKSRTRGEPSLAAV